MKGTTKGSRTEAKRRYRAD